MRRRHEKAGEGGYPAANSMRQKDFSRSPDQCFPAPEMLVFARRRLLSYLFETGFPEGTRRTGKATNAESECLWTEVAPAAKPAASDRHGPGLRRHGPYWLPARRRLLDDSGRARHSLGGFTAGASVQTAGRGLGASPL